MQCAELVAESVEGDLGEFMRWRQASSYLAWIADLFASCVLSLVRLETSPARTKMEGQTRSHLQYSRHYQRRWMLHVLGSRLTCRCFEQTLRRCLGFL